MAMIDFSYEQSELEIIITLLNPALQESAMGGLFNRVK